MYASNLRRFCDSAAAEAAACRRAAAGFPPPTLTLPAPEPSAPGCWSPKPLDCSSSHLAVQSLRPHQHAWQSPPVLHTRQYLLISRILQDRARMTGA